MKKALSRFWCWAERTYWISDLPFRDRLEPLFILVRSVRALVFPKSAYRIENLRVAVTNICNAACVFCNYPLRTMKGRVMSLETFKAAMPYFAGQLHVDLSPTIGDPLVDPGLRDKALLLFERGYKIHLTTNGVLIAKHADWLLEHAANVACIYFSTPSFDAADYQVQYGVDKGEQCMNGIYDFLRRNDAMGQPIIVRYHVRNREHPSTYLKSEAFKRFKPLFHGRVSYHFSPYWDNWSGAVQWEKWSDYMRDRVRSVPQIARPCKQLRGAIVNPDGEVRLCGCRLIGTDKDDLRVGKLGDSIELLTANAVKIRQQFYTKDYPTVCRGCSFYTPE